MILTDENKCVFAGQIPLLIGFKQVKRLYFYIMGNSRPAIRDSWEGPNKFEEHFIINSHH